MTFFKTVATFAQSSRFRLGQRTFARRTAPRLSKLERFESMDEMIAVAQRQKSGHHGRVKEGDGSPSKYNRTLGWLCLGAITSVCAFAAYRRLYESKQPYPRSVRRHMRKALYARYLGGTVAYISEQLLLAMDRLRDLGYGTGSRQFIGAAILLAEVLEDKGAFEELVPVLKSLVLWDLAGGESKLAKEACAPRPTVQATFSLEEYLPPPQNFDRVEDRLHLAVRLMQKLGDIYWLKLNNHADAEPCYSWSLKTLLGWVYTSGLDPSFEDILQSQGSFSDTANDGAEPSRNTLSHVPWIGSAELVSAIEKLASFYASDAVNKPELAIPLYYRCAQLLSSSKQVNATTTLVAENFPELGREFQSTITPCRGCIVINNLAECYTRLTKQVYLREAEKWLQLSIKDSTNAIKGMQTRAPDSNGSHNLQECFECKAVGQYNLGAVYELLQNVSAAELAYRKAIEACELSPTESEAISACKKSSKRALDALR